MTLSFLVIAASPWIIGRFVVGHVGPRAGAVSYLVSVLAGGVATGILLALILLKFLSSSLLAAMGDACGGIFEASHGFLAASRWNYLLAVGIAAAFFLQVAFLVGGGTRLLKVTHRLKKSAAGKALSCPALAQLNRDAGIRHLLLVPDNQVEALTVGLLRPRILFHSGLVQALSADELAAVLAHEEAHRAGRDNLLVTVTKAISLTLFYLPGPRVALKEMRRLLEKAADRRAAAVTGPLPVAEALLRIAGVPDRSQHAPLPAVFVSGSSPAEITGRLEALLKGKETRRGRFPRVVLIAVLGVLALGAFASSALAATDTDQRGALTCFTEHTRGAVDDGVCGSDHEEHAAS